MIEHAVISAFPASWRRERLGNLAWVRARLGWKGLTADEYVDSGIPMLATPNIKGTHIDFASANRITVQRYEESPEIKLRLGDVLLTKDGSTIGIANVVRSLPEPATVNGSIAVLTPNNRLDSAFLLWLLRSNEYQALMRSWQDGMGVPHLFQFDIKRIPAALPSTREQRAIADCLDQETAQIDAFIAKNEELITLLTERRAAVIARAVTKGLDDTAELKESGVPALGSIPAGWTVSRVRNVGRAIIGLTYAPEDICDEDDGGTLVLRAGNIQDSRLDFEDCVYVSKQIPDSLRLRLGDIVICARNGSARLIGKNALATDEVEGQTWGAFMAVLRTPINAYLRWVLNSTIFTSSLGAFATSTINQLTSSTLHSLQFALPPHDEQVAISAYLETATESIDKAIRAAGRATDLARERRAALISAAVTGKIDPGVAV